MKPGLSLALVTLTSVAALAGARPAAAAPAPAPQPPASFLVGTAAVDITPSTPVTMAAYGTYRVSQGVQPGRRFMARSLAISAADGSTAHTVVLTVLDSQGYFIAYKEDPLTDPGHFGTDGIRAAVKTDTGLDVEHVIVSTTHTHNSPDSIGVWGGGEDPRNEAYLAVVRAGAIRSIEGALAHRRAATLSVGVTDARRYLDTLGQVRGDPTDYPLDRLLRVLQARDARGLVVATLVNLGVHGTVLGAVPLLSPDWPGEVDAQLDARWGAGTTLAVPGAVGRTWPTFPDPHAGNDWQRYLRAFGADVVGLVDTAMGRSRPVVDGTVTAAGHRITEVITDPAAYPLLYSKTVAPGVIGGTMRSNLPPYLLGATLTTDLNALRVGDLFLGGAPGEAYPEVQSELQRRVLGAQVCGDPVHVFALSLTNDQVGYTTPSDEYALALAYGGDEGIFAMSPVIGNDVINGQLANARALGLATGPDYNGVTAGPLLPPPNTNTQAPPLVDASGPAPQCPVSAAISGEGGADAVASAPIGAPNTARPDGGAGVIASVVVLLGVLARRRSGRLSRRRPRDAAPSP